MQQRVQRRRIGEVKPLRCARIGAEDGGHCQVDEISVFRLESTARAEELQRVMPIVVLGGRRSTALAECNYGLCPSPAASNVQRCLAKVVHGGGVGIVLQERCGCTSTAHLPAPDQHECGKVFAEDCDIWIRPTFEQRRGCRPSLLLGARN